LPLLLLLVFGVLDFGRAFKTKIILTNAAREGTHYFMYDQADYQSGSFPKTKNTVAAEAFNSGVEVDPFTDVDVFCYLDANNNGIVDSGEVPNEYDCSGFGNKRSTIVVTVEKPFTFVMFDWLFKNILNKITGEARMLVP